MRFGIDMNTDHTLEEVGKQFDVTRERIRQIEAKALRKLRHPTRSDYLRSFLDEGVEPRIVELLPPRRADGGRVLLRQLGELRRRDLEFSYNFV